MFQGNRFTAEVIQFHISISLDWPMFERHEYKDKRVGFMYMFMPGK